MILISLHGLQTLQTLQLRSTTLLFSVYICPCEIVYSHNEFLAAVPVMPSMWRQAGMQCQATSNNFSQHRPSAA